MLRTRFFLLPFMLSAFVSLSFQQSSDFQITHPEVSVQDSTTSTTATTNSPEVTTTTNSPEVTTTTNSPEVTTTTNSPEVTTTTNSPEVTTTTNSPEVTTTTSTSDAKTTGDYSSANTTSDNNISTTETTSLTNETTSAKSASNNWDLGQNFTGRSNVTEGVSDSSNTTTPATDVNNVTESSTITTTTAELLNSENSFSMDCLAHSLKCIHDYPVVETYCKRFKRTEECIAKNPGHLCSATEYKLLIQIFCGASELFDGSGNQSSVSQDCQLGVATCLLSSPGLKQLSEIYTFKLLFCDLKKLEKTCFDQEINETDCTNEEYATMLTKAQCTSSASSLLPAILLMWLMFVLQRTFGGD